MKDLKGLKAKIILHKMDEEESIDIYEYIKAIENENRDLKRLLNKKERKTQ